MLRKLGSRLVHAYTTAPTLRQWGETGLLLVAFAVVALPVGLAGGLIRYAPTADSVGSLVLFAVMALVVPSLFEETLFRALLLPHSGEPRSGYGLIVNVAVAVSLFILGHPFVAWLFVSAARPLFWDPVFLILCAGFGVVSSIAYLRTGSIWPSVMMHWAIVVVWKIWFGGWIMMYGPPGP